MLRRPRACRAAARMARTGGARRLPRAARRRASGRVCRGGLGAAAVADRICRLGRCRAGAARACVYLRRRPLHAAGARPGRSVDLHAREPGRDAAACLDPQEFRQGCADRLRPWLQPSPRQGAARGRRKGRRRIGRGRSQSDRGLWRTGWRRRSEKIEIGRSIMPASSPRTGWRVLLQCSPRRARPTPCLPIHRPSPGLSTFAATTCRITRLHWPSPCCRPKGRICFSSTGASS